MFSRIDKPALPHWPENVGESPYGDDSLRMNVAVDRSSTGRLATSATATARPPEAVYIPAQYEANYAYPLIIWLHADGGSEQELADVLPAVSPQNYLGLAIRGPLPADQPVPLGFRWSKSEHSDSSLLETLHEVVRRMGRRYNVHSERIYLAGFDQGGMLALRLLLTRPEWFAGAVCLGGSFPRMRYPLAQFPRLRGKRVLLVTGRRDGKVSPTEIMRAGRLLHAAGLRVQREVVDAGHERTPEMLRLVNPWVIADVCQPVI